MWWIIAWIACGVFAWGWEFAYVQGRFPNLAKQDYKKDLIIAIYCSLFGPAFLLAFIITCFISGTGIEWYGWRLW